MLARLVLVALSLVLAACSGVPGGASNTPVGVVQTALDRMAAKQVDQLPELACAAQRDSIADELDLTGGLTDVIPGLDASSFLEAVDFDVSKVVLRENSLEGDTAQVGMTGTIGIDFDEAKLREVMKPVLEAQGMPTDDATLDAMLGGVSAMAQNLPIDATVEVVREDGAWKICDTSFGGG